MGTVILIFVLLSILLYLIIAGSDEARKMNTKERKESWGLLNLAKMNVELTARFFKQQAIIRRLENINADLRSEHEDYLILKNNTLEFSKEIISQIEDIKLVNNKNILEYDKKQQIKKLTKSMTKECIKFITKNELDALTQHLIQK